MINVIYGAKGSGKTQKIIDKANAKANTSKGCVLYLTDRAEHSDGVDNSIRFINVNSYGIADENRFYFSFTQDKNIAEETVILLNKNQVAPCHIADIIEDMFYSG